MADCDELARNVPRVRRQRILVDLVFVGDDDDWESQIANCVLGNDLVYVDTKLLEDVDLTDGRDRVGAE